MPLITRFEDIQAWQAARKLVNIAEEFDCASKAEFARFLGFARRSAVEVQSRLYAAFDTEYINETQLKEYYEQARRTKALIGGFKHSLKNPPDTWNLAPTHGA